MDREKTALLCVVGAREDGVKELLGMELGYRESTESWSGVLRSLRDRSLSARYWRWETVRWVCGLRSMPVPDAGHQRCWNHRALNVQSKLPKALTSEARRQLREMSYAPTRVECERFRDSM